jgi:excisionase family DNA binding protein
MAYVVERGEGKKKRFAIRWINEFGKEKQKSIKATTEKQAQTIADALELQAQHIKLGIAVAPPPPKLFSEVAEAYRQTIKRKVSVQSIEARLDLHLLPRLKDRYVHTITGGDCDDLFGELAFDPKENPNGLAPQSVRHVRNTLKKVFDYAIKKEWVRGTNPVLAAEKISVKKPLANPVDVENLAPLFLQLSPWWVTLFKTAAGCGLRKCELCGLLVGDVDLEARIISVRRSYDRLTTKDDEERLVVIPEKLVPILAQQIGKRPRSAPLFPSEAGGMIPPNKKLATMLRQALVRAGKIAEWEVHCRRGASRRLNTRTEWGCDFRERRSSGEQTRCPTPKCGKLLWVKPIPIWHTFKDLRSTFATILYEATGDKRAVQKQMGHGSETTTDRHYLRTDTKRLVALADKMPLGDALAAGYTPTLAVANGPDAFLTGDDDPTQGGENVSKNPSQVSALSSARPAGLEPTTLGLEGRTPQLPGRAAASQGVGRLRVPSAPAFRRVLQRATAPYHVPDTFLTADPFTRLTVVEGGAGLLTVQEVASILQVAPDTVRLRIKTGHLPVVRMGSAIQRVRVQDLRAMLEKSYTAAAPRPEGSERPLGEVQLKVLAYVANRRRPTTVHEVRLHFGWNSDGTVTKIKRSLEERGLLEPSSRRNPGLWPTEAGRALVNPTTTEGKP